MQTFKPYAYQQRAIDWVIEHPGAGLFLDMGLGKSVITLTAFRQLQDYCEVDTALVVAPKKVAESTWTDEAAKWAHLSHLRISKVMGTAARRKKALAEEADIYVINRDNFAWLCGIYGGRLPFDMLIIDELTSFKTAKSQRFKALKLVRPTISRVVGLTGTPAPNGMYDLWAQVYALDMGARLGKSITRYREKYFKEFTRNFIVIRRDLREGAEQGIRDAIADICLTMQARDYLELPPMITHTIAVPLSPEVQKAYTDFERTQVLELQQAATDDVDADAPLKIPAASAAALMGKLSQFANGAIYDEQKQVHHIHDEKLERLAELIEEAAGASVLVFYQYRHDAERIKAKLKGLRVAMYKDAAQLRQWNAGELDVLLAHPASTAYGLNMQQGGHYIVWYGTGWDLELYQQANARLHRQGQQHPVIVYRLICRGTVDERAAAALDDKNSTQQKLLDGLAELMRKYAAEK